MSNINDVRPLCELIKQRELFQSNLVLKKWRSGVDNLIEADEAWYVSKKEKELLFKNNEVKVLKDE